MKKNKNSIIIIVIVAVAILAVTVLVLHNSGNRNSAQKQTEKGTLDMEALMKATVVSPEVLESVSNKVETIKDVVKPGENTLEVDKIQGYTSKKKVKNKATNAKKTENSDKDNGFATKTGEETKIELSDPNLIIETVGSYMGNYLEDGSDEPIQNVASIIITNTSDKMLQVGDITFQVNDKDKATFRVTNLLPHTSALVLEANKREYSDNDDYSYGKVATSYLDKPDLLKKTFKITKKNGKLTLKNKTDKTYKKVYVYYKYLLSGGAFMGGITYRVPFENVEGGKEVSSDANHLNANTSMIVDVQIAEE